MRISLVQLRLHHREEGLLKNSNLLQFPAPTARTTTCQMAVEICKTPGTRIHWRPNDAVNWMLPELDVAHVLEG